MDLKLSGKRTLVTGYNATIWLTLSAVPLNNLCR